MDPRLREDDDSNVILDPRLPEADGSNVMSVPRFPSFLRRQESIPWGLGGPQAFNFALQVAGPGAAVTALGQGGAADGHLGYQAVRAERAPKRSNQGVVINETWRHTDLAAVPVHKTQRHRLHRHIGADGGLRR